MHSGLFKSPVVHCADCNVVYTTYATPTETVFKHLAPYSPMCQMSLQGSAFTTVALTVERYISVVTPFFRQRHNLKASTFLYPVAVFVVIYNIPRFFEMKTEYQEAQKCVNATSAPTYDEQLTVEGAYPLHFVNSSVACFNYTMPELTITELRKNKFYISIYCTWLNVIFNTLIPITILIGMNIRIYLTMKGQWHAGSSDHFHSPAGSELGEDKSPPLAALESTGGSSASLPVKYGELRSCARKMSRIISRKRRPEEVGADEMIMRFSSKHKSVRTQLSLTERGRNRPVTSSIYTGHGGRVRRVGLDEREMKKRDAKYTRASVMMVLVYISCQAPRVLVNVMELYYGGTFFYQSPKWVMPVVTISSFLTVMNSSLNFLIYLSFCGTGQKKKRPTTTYSFYSSRVARSRNSFNGASTNISTVPSTTASSSTQRISQNIS